ncbi:MAG: PPC domain-containing DNA-binding protein [Methanomassiliicoccales archaeon]
MRYAEARQGRVFVIRLEDGEDLHGELERFAEEKGIQAAALIILGGADGTSRLVVGPESESSTPIVPQVRMLLGIHEIGGTGTIFRDEKGSPVLHMHLATGRGDHTLTGCSRAGVRIWQVAEVVIFELLDSGALRKFQEDTGFTLLDFDPKG